MTITGGLLLMTAASLAGAALQLAGLHRPEFVLPPVFPALFCDRQRDERRSE